MNISLMVGAGPGLLSVLSQCVLPLAPGLHTVQWRIFTADGHISHGRFWFQVAGQEGGVPRLDNRDPQRLAAHLGRHGTVVGQTRPGRTRGDPCAVARLSLISRSLRRAHDST